MEVLEEKLEELAQEYKKELKKAYIYANTSYQFEDLELLQMLDNEAKRALSSYIERRIRQRRMALIYTTFIMTACYIVALSFLLLYTSESDIKLIMMMLSAIASISICLFLITFIPFKRNKFNSAQIKYDLIRTWNELENITNELTGNKGKTRYMSPKRALVDAGALSPEEEKDIVRLLALRNKIVHSLNDNISDKEIIDVTNSVKKIISHLHKQ